MDPHDSRAVSKSLEAYVGHLIAESSFFSDLSTGRANPEDVRGVFCQYYLWRNQFHRWFGTCVARSAPFGQAPNAPRILGALVTCLEQEIREDHHGMALSFLAALGIDDISRITALPVTALDHKADIGRLIEAARLEIWEHITFWDDVYSAILDIKSEFSS
jgi:hypothetical protein